MAVFRDERERDRFLVDCGKAAGRQEALEQMEEYREWKEQQDKDALIRGAERLRRERLKEEYRLKNLKLGWPLLEKIKLWVWRIFFVWLAWWAFNKYLLPHISQYFSKVT